MKRIRLCLSAVSLLCLTAFAGLSLAQPEVDPVRKPKTETARNPVGAAPATPLQVNGAVNKPRTYMGAGLPMYFEAPMGMPGGMGPGMMGGMPHPAMRHKTVTRTVQDTILVAISPEEAEQNKAFQDSMQALRDAKDDNARKEAMTGIRQHLVQQFEQDTNQRETELASIEERLKSLRQQLEKRKASKDEIIELRLKTVVNNAEGLGFPGEEGPQEGTILQPLPTARFPDEGQQPLKPAYGIRRN